jgi:predicted O-linked N-acetylglucosamine transferase (SPINDLY family)
MPTIAEAVAFGQQCHQAGDLARAEQLYLQVLQADPSQAQVRFYLGAVYQSQGRLADAVALFRQVLAARPDHAEVLNNLGVALAQQRQFEEAVDCLRRAAASQPGWAEPLINLGNVLADHGELDEAAAAHEAVVRLAPADAEAHNRLGSVLAIQGRLAEAHRHFAEALLENFAYAEVAGGDAVTARLRSLVRGWRCTCGLADEAVAAQVRADGIDVLVDLAGHSANNRLRVFTSKPAPVQATYLGYPNTTGLTAVDYLLTDAVVDPPGEPAWSTEALVRLEGGFCCYAPRAGAPAVAPLPALAAGRVTFGAPHHLAKLNPEVIGLWCGLLRAVPSARLLLCRNTLTGAARDRLEQQFARHGVGPGRLEWRRAEDVAGGYLGVYAATDVLLDTTPWSGHTTACESLWMGVPVLTLCGRRHAGRMAASVLTRLGLTDWVARTAEEFVALGVRWAAEVGRLAELRAGLRERMRASGLCDGRAFARTLEAAYREMWRRWCGARPR